MNILVTGAAGALGRNLVENLKCIRDGKNRTRPNLTIDSIFEYDQKNTLEELEQYCESADFIIHAAGVNRPKEDSEFMEGNFGFTSTLLDMLKYNNNRSPILITSSVQATLAGRFGDTEYGRSKLAGEELMFNYATETGVTVYVYRFHNMVGKWIRPRYNSVVATFCYCIARDEPIVVNDPNTELEMVFFDDLCEEIYDAMEEHPHCCEYPKAGEVVDGITYNGVMARADGNGKYCYCPITYKATLGQIVELLNSFHDEGISVPEIPPGSFEYKLYSMYLSYLPKDKNVIPLRMNVDERGSFTELLHSKNYGQVSINITKPGQKKGEHWHNSKNERFIVVSGYGLIQMRKIGTNEIWEFEVSGGKLESITMIPGYSHNLINLSDTEDLVTIIWTSEIYDPDRPDTYRELVRSEEREY